MGKLVKNHKWLPDKQGKFHLPKSISLSELHDDLEINKQSVVNLAKKLELKEEIDEGDNEGIGTNDRKKQLNLIKDKLNSLTENGLIKIENLMSSLLENSDEENDINTIFEIKEALEEATRNTSNIEKEKDKDDFNWNHLTVDEEEIIQRNYGENLINRLNEISSEYKTTNKKEMKSKNKINPKMYLKQEYDGSCQICNTRLAITKNPPLFFVYRILTLQNKRGWANLEFNVICLCPNCWSILRYGNSNLKNIFHYAEKVAENEFAAEHVDERGGSYYIIDIEILGKTREIYYSQNHMQKLTGFYRASQNSK
ncbi:hypothetical protein LCGC14_0767010 [marine sediment metagenome]|uniref:Uncharacterized protein n=1 Tax=marine sediment metagenome TaxID=412755 RepID=A0A0F9QJ88_9ZZZZ